MLFAEGGYPVHRKLTHTKLDGLRRIGYDNRRRRDEFDIPQDAIWGCNGLIFQILSCLMSLDLISLSRKYYHLEVWPIVAPLRRRWMPCSHRRFRCFAHRPMGLLDWMQVYVLKKSGVHAQMTGGDCRIRPSTESISLAVLESAWRGKEIISKTILNTSQLWIWCSFMAIVIPWPLKWYFGGTGKRAKSMIARFEYFDLIVKSMFRRL